MRIINKENPTLRLRLRVCDRCGEYYKGTKFSDFCKKCYKTHPKKKKSRGKLNIFGFINKLIEKGEYDRYIKSIQRKET